MPLLSRLAVGHSINVSAWKERIHHLQKNTKNAAGVGDGINVIVKKPIEV